MIIKSGSECGVCFSEGGLGSDRSKRRWDENLSGKWTRRCAGKTGVFSLKDGGEFVDDGAHNIGLITREVFQGCVIVK
jgi:hypothetical protein